MTTVLSMRVLLVVSLVVIMATGIQTYAAPRQAPPFTVEMIPGGTLSLAQLKGKAVVLLFWAPW